MGAEVLGLREVSCHTQTHTWSLAAIPSWVIPIRKHHPGTPAHRGQCLCSALAHLIWVERCWGDAASTAQHEMKTLQHSAWSRRCLHIELLKSWLKINLSHVIFLVPNQFFICSAALWGEEQHSDGACNLRAKFDLFPASLHSDFSGCVPLTKIKLCSDRCKAAQLLHLQGSKGSIFLSSRPFRWAHLMTAIFTYSVKGFIITASTTWTEVGASFTLYLIQFKSLFLKLWYRRHHIYSLVLT